MPEGGYSEVVGNLIQQGPNAENSSTVLSYGAESTTPEMVLLIAHNTLVNDKDNSPAFVRTKGATEVVMRNNLFIGTGTPLETSSDPNVDSLGDLQVEDGSELMGRLAYDYQLSSAATAIDSGSSIQAPFSQLIPNLEYIPGGTRARWDDGPPDVGAYGIGEPKDSRDNGNKRRQRHGLRQFCRPRRYRLCLRQHINSAWRPLALAPWNPCAAAA